MTEVRWIPSDATCARPSQHAPGTLLAIGPRPNGKIFWALRFDDIDGSEDVPSLYWLNESIHGGPLQSTISRCKDFEIDVHAVVGIGRPNFTVRIDFSLEDAIPRHKIDCHDAKAHVAIGDFGIRLCGYDRYLNNSRLVWVDCLTWRTDAATLDQVISNKIDISGYAPTWQVVAQRMHDSSIRIPFAR